MNFHKGEGPPCKNMENLLQQVADGTLQGPKKWYAVAHASQCSNCGTFLQRLQASVTALKASKEEPSPETMNRLMAQIKQLENQSKDA